MTGKQKAAVLPEPVCAMTSAGSRYGLKQDAPSGHVLKSEEAKRTQASPAPYVLSCHVCRDLVKRPHAKPLL